jgi:hypothetical protein
VHLDELHEQPECVTALLKFVLASMLLDLPVHLVRDFWDDHPLHRGGDILEGSQLLHFLWKEDERLPLGYYLQALNDLEPYLLRFGLSAQEMLARNLMELNGGSPLPPRLALKTMRQLMPSIFTMGDLRHAIFDVIPVLNKYLAPGTSTLTINAHPSQEGWRGRWVVITHGSGYLRTMPAIDPVLWIEPVLRESPVRLGLPAIESVDCFGEARRLEEILPPSELERKSGEWWSHDQLLAKVTSLQDFCEGIGFDAGAEGIPDIPVQLALADWFCPIRKRVLVKAGHLYGCPSYLVSVSYKKSDFRSFPGVLGALIDEALSDGGTAWKRANELFEQLVEEFGSIMRFVYHRHDESITFNGSHILRYTPAKILQKVLIAYSVTGREEFEHKEFRRDPDLGLDPNAPNLESRLRLLAKRLDNRCPALRIEKSGRGKFRLMVHGQVEFREQDF